MESRKEITTENPEVYTWRTGPHTTICLSPTQATLPAIHTAGWPQRIPDPPTGGPQANAIRLPHRRITHTPRTACVAPTAGPGIRVAPRVTGRGRVSRNEKGGARRQSWPACGAVSCRGTHGGGGRPHVARDAAASRTRTRTARPPAGFKSGRMRGGRRVAAAPGNCARRLIPNRHS